MMDESARRVVDEKHASNLDNTLRELQLKVREHEQELQRLRSSAPGWSLAGASPTAPLEVMKTAFAATTQAEPFLPFPDSVLPALLALRKTQQTIRESQAYLDAQGASLDQARRRLEAERAGLAEQQLLTQAIEQRIGTLREDLEARADTTPADAARQRLAELESRRARYDHDTTRLLRSLNRFIDGHLAALLAAEDLGGPVVGDAMELDGADLAAGFDSRGNLKKAGKAAASGANGHDDRRQRRIDEIWGGPEGRTAQQRRGKEEWDEVAGAAQEMRRLTETLLNRLIESGSDASAAYVTLEKETAAARFLVRSKVAQFHPRDSTRLRLIDFGRELDD